MSSRWELEAVRKSQPDRPSVSIIIEERCFPIDDRTQVTPMVRWNRCCASSRGTTPRGTTSRGSSWTCPPCAHACSLLSVVESVSAASLSRGRIKAFVRLHGMLADPPFRTLEEAKRLARRRLPKVLFDRIVDPMDPTQQTLAENTRVFDDVLFRPRAATYIPKRDLAVTVLGTDISFPVMLACPGTNRIWHPDGEKAAAIAAERAAYCNILPPWARAIRWRRCERFRTCTADLYVARS